MEINTDKIEEAQVVVETKKNTETDDLLSRVSKQTAHKSPGTNEPVPEKSFWESSPDDFETQTEKPATEKPTEQKKDNEEKSDNDKEPLNDKSFHNSASNATFLLDVATEGLCKIVVSRKYKKRFTTEEKEILRNGLVDADPKTLNPEQKSLYDKYQKLTAKKEEVFSKLPFDDDEKQIMEDSWYRYFKQKNKELPPEAAVIMSVLTSVGSRVIDVAFDE